MRKGFLIWLMMLAFVAAASAQVQEAGVFYSSKNIWHGFKVTQSEAAVEPFAQYKLYGVDVGIAGNVATDDKYEDQRRVNYSLGYVLNEILNIGYDYSNYPSSSSHSADSSDFHELKAKVDIPIPIKNAKLTYDLIYVSPFNSGSEIDAGWLHVLTGQYQIDRFNLMAEVTYNEGVNPFGDVVFNDFSHILLAASVDVDINETLKLQPTVYQQIAINDAIENETWFGLGFVYRQ